MNLSRDQHPAPPSLKFPNKLPLRRLFLFKGLSASRHAQRGEMRWHLCVIIPCQECVSSNPMLGPNIPACVVQCLTWLITSCPPIRKALPYPPLHGARIWVARRWLPCIFLHAVKEPSMKSVATPNVKGTGIIHYQKKWGDVVGIRRIGRTKRHPLTC
ncbi:hypothetical protein F5148DRAFT_29804 [Russula earlei]|uniref:Uncharacterized protein n=1 Tax=Russula earlei TaxID=71964 RepID=A0ACC0U913_9AGAM|nr:hypothetical protein F5148DRAFT_29804 [Russula earlei]